MALEDAKYANLMVNMSHELGSEDDTIEDNIPSTQNECLTQYKEIIQGKGKWDWTLNLQHGMMNINGKDYAYKNMKCHLDF